MCICHCVSFDFFSQQRCYLHSQPSFCSARLSFVLCSFESSLFVRVFGFRELNGAKFNGNGNEYNGCVSACKRPILSNLDAVLRILFGIFLTV